jgi:hypothetical protein
MDTYLNVYKGYYVSGTMVRLQDYADDGSLLETVPDVTTKGTTGFEAVSTMSSMFLATDYQQPRLRQR